MVPSAAALSTPTHPANVQTRTARAHTHTHTQLTSHRTHQGTDTAGAALAQLPSNTHTQGTDTLLTHATDMVYPSNAHTLPTQRAGAAGLEVLGDTLRCWDGGGETQRGSTACSAEKMCV